MMKMIVPEIIKFTNREREREIERYREAIYLILASHQFKLTCEESCLDFYTFFLSCLLESTI